MRRPTSTPSAYSGSSSRTRAEPNTETPGRMPLSVSKAVSNSSSTSESHSLLSSRVVARSRNRVSLGAALTVSGSFSASVGPPRVWQVARPGSARRALPLLHPAEGERPVEGEALERALAVARAAERAGDLELLARVEDRVDRRHLAARGCGLGAVLQGDGRGERVGEGETPSAARPRLRADRLVGEDAQGAVVDDDGPHPRVVARPAVEAGGAAAGLAVAASAHDRIGVVRRHRILTRRGFRLRDRI